MNDHVLFDEFHLSFHVPKALDDGACEAIRRILQSRPFRLALRQAVRQTIRQYPDLNSVRVRISV